MHIFAGFTGIALQDNTREAMSNITEEKSIRLNNELNVLTWGYTREPVATFCFNNNISSV